MNRTLISVEQLINQISSTILQYKMSLERLVTVTKLHCTLWNARCALGTILFAACTHAAAGSKDGGSITISMYTYVITNFSTIGNNNDLPLIIYS